MTEQRNKKEYLEIPRIADISPTDEKAVDAAFERLTPQPIACCNWAEQFPYTPKVTFRAFHTDRYLMLQYDVDEEVTMACVAADNGEVWTDSCVEFFIAPDNESYYNFECNCIGRLLLGYHKIGKETQQATPDIMSSILRRSTLGEKPFEERKGNNHWRVTLAIPPAALFGESLTSWAGVKARANFYKCGDHLSQPHFLSWRPIVAPKPNFHLPQFFEQIKFSNI